MSKYAKSIGAFLVGTHAWGLIVVESSPTDITSGEWIGLYGVIVATFTVFALPNSEPEG